MDFVALDFETANPSWASICQVGIVEFQKGEPVRRFSSLVDPQDHFHSRNVLIHRIRPADVAGAPTFPELYPALMGMLFGRIVVCHSPFDRGALKQAIARHNLKDIDCRWLDSREVARQTWVQGLTSGYGLDSIADRLGIQFNHHDALEDAFAAGTILVRAVLKSGLGIEEWLSKAPVPAGASGMGRQLREASITSRPQYEVPVRRDGDPSGPLFGHYLVFTGALRQLSREEAAAKAALVGCAVTDGVSKRTTILVVGVQDVRRLRPGERKSTKQRKAEDLIASGYPIRIIGEADFVSLCWTSPAHAS